MSLLYEKLKSLFSLKKGTIETANRTTLNRFVQETELQRRRQSLYQASCGHGKQKSRVSLCKKTNRPSFAIQLSTLTTKQLRETILEFMQDIGFHQGEGKSEKQLKQLARKYKWNAVLYLSDDLDEPEEEPGHKKKAEGGPEDPNIKKWDAGKEARKVKIEQIDEETAKAHPQQARRKKRPKRARSAPRGRVNLPPSPAAAVDPNIIPHRRARVLVPSAVTLYQPTSRKLNAQGEYIHPPPTDFAEPPGDLSTIPELHDEELEFQEDPPIHLEKKDTIEPLPERLKRKRKTKSRAKLRQDDTLTQTVVDEQAKTKDDSKLQPLGGDEPGSKTMRTCSLIEPFEDACESCEPTPFHEIKLSRKQKKEFNRLNSLRKMTCAKLALLKCTLDLQEYQRKVWDAENLNTGGDYFSRATEKDLKKLQYTLPDRRDDLKAILRNQGASYRVKVGAEHQKTRIQGAKKKLGPTYTLAGLRYDELEDEHGWTNDKYTNLAIKNRPKVDRPIPGKVSCQNVDLPEPECKKCSEKHDDKKAENTSPPQKDSHADGVQKDEDGVTPEITSEKLSSSQQPNVVRFAQDMGHLRSLTGKEKQSPSDDRVRFSRDVSQLLADDRQPPVVASAVGHAEVSPVVRAPPPSLPASPSRRSLSREPSAMLPPTPAKQMPDLAPPTPAIRQRKTGKEQTADTLKPILRAQMLQGDKDAEIKLHRLYYWKQDPDMSRKYEEYRPDLDTSDEEIFEQWLNESGGKAASGFGDIDVIPPPDQPPSGVPADKEVLHEDGMRPDKIVKSFEDKPRGVSVGQHVLGINTSKEIYAKQYAEYKEKFLRPLNIYITNQRFLLRVSAEVDSFLDSVEQHGNIVTEQSATRLYSVLRPIFDSVEWVDREAPFEGDRQVSADVIKRSHHAFFVLKRTPDSLAPVHILDMLLLISPQKIKAKQAERLIMEQGLQLEQAVHTQKSNDLQALKDSMLAETLETKASGALTKPKKKKVPKRSGVMSRVGFLLGKRGRKKRKPRKKQAKKQKLTKPRVKRDVRPQSVNVDKIVDDGPDIPSPRFKRDRSPSPPRQRDTAQSPPKRQISDYVVKRKNKRLL